MFVMLFLLVGFVLGYLLEERILEGRPLTQRRGTLRLLVVLGDRVSGTSLGDDSVFGADRSLEPSDAAGARREGHRDRAGECAIRTSCRRICSI